MRLGAVGCGWASIRVQYDLGVKFLENVKPRGAYIRHYTVCDGVSNTIGEVKDVNVNGLEASIQPS